MAVVMEDWSRPAFEPGGGDATLFYLAFGALGPVRLPPTPAGLSLTVHPQGEAVWVEPLVAASADAMDGQPQLAALVRGASDFAVLRGRRTDPPDLAHLRDAEAVLAALLDAGAAAVLDVEARRPAVRAHVSVRARQGRVETRGLRKFGRPDLRFHRVPPDEEPEALRLCWSLVERLARGVRPGPDFSAGRLRLHPSAEAGHPALEAEWPPPPLPHIRSA